jgi:hypothetical protein
MAEFNCYICKNAIKTGEKFTFTKKGAVHFSCFVSERNREIKKEDFDKLRALTILMDSELQHLLNILSIKDVPTDIQEKIRIKYKNIEKEVNETTQMILSL